MSEELDYFIWSALSSFPRRQRDTLTHTRASSGTMSDAERDAVSPPAPTRGVSDSARALARRWAARATLHDSWNIELWAESLGFHRSVSHALQPPPGTGPFEYLRSLSSEVLQQKLEENGLGGLHACVWKGVCGLREQEASTGSRLNAKFASDDSVFEMTFGTLELFFGGLEKLIGPPLLLGGTLLGAMRREHVDSADSEETFT
jgi:hypothetical protein